MVVVVHPQASKKPKLSLFRLGKSPKTTSAAEVLQRTSLAEEASSSSPFEFPELDDSSPPRRITASNSIETRPRADSLPMTSLALFSQGPKNDYAPTRPSFHLLNRVQSEGAVLSNHSRQRSHFSIPDVIITTCEEEGNEEVVEVRIAPGKRRSYVLKQIHTQHDPFPPKSSKKTKMSGLMFGRKPAPLLSFSEDELTAMHQGGPMHDLDDCAEDRPRSASPTSQISSSLSKSNAARVLRKASFPNLFGRKSLDSSTNTCSSPIFAETSTPSSAPAQDSVFFSRPSMSKDERPAFALAKKEQKAKAKQEQALIKDLERINKLVKQHDQKSQRSLEKSQAKEYKRLVKLGYHNASGLSQPSSDAQAGVKPKMTVFSASTRSSSSAAIGRRTSARSIAAMRASENPRGEPFTFPRATSRQEAQFEPVLTRAVGGPSAAPALRNVVTGNITPETVSPPRAQRCTTTSLARSDTTATERDTVGNMSDEFDTQNWTPGTWSSFEPTFASQLPSLVVTSSSSNSSNGSQPVKRSVDVFDEDFGADEEELATRLGKRASVQRILVLSDAGNSLLQKQASLRKRQSQIRRRSSRVDSVTTKKLQEALTAVKQASQQDDGEWEEETPTVSGASSIAHDSADSALVSSTPSVASSSPAEVPPRSRPAAPQKRPRPVVPARAATRPVRASVVQTSVSSPPLRPSSRLSSQSSVSTSASSESVCTVDLLNSFGLDSTFNSSPTALDLGAVYAEQPRPKGSLADRPALQSVPDVINVTPSNVESQSTKAEYRMSFAPLPPLDLFDNQ